MAMSDEGNVPVHPVFPWQESRRVHSERPTTPGSSMKSAIDAYVVRRATCDEPAGMNSV
jgi:hypothetical protein